MARCLPSGTRSSSPRTHSSWTCSPEAYAAGVFRAPDHEGRRVWHELQSGVFEELELHAATSQEMGIDLTQVTPLQATRAYTDFLLANAFGGTLGELVAAMAPCMRLYFYLGFVPG